MKKFAIYIVALMMTSLFLMASLSCNAQSVDELQIKVKKLEAQNSALEAKLKKCGKNNKNSADQEKMIEYLNSENSRLNAEINAKNKADADKAASDEAKKTMKLNIKDPVFKEYLLRYCDMDDDGVLTQWDADRTYIIDITRDKSVLKLMDGSNEVTSLDGIEHFVNLKKLVCSGNRIPQMDLSKNVQLQTLIANGCDLKLLNVSKNVELVNLECNNNLLYTIDLKSNTKLQKLDLYKNKMAAIDLSNCTQLKTLMCAENTLTTLDVSKNTALESINCSNNKLTELSFVNNVKLENIICNSNSLTTIDLQNGQNIKYLDCSKNKNLQYVVLSQGKRVYEDKKDTKTRYK
ncbi:MAG: hypothetical protein IKX35_08760 [Bacteroidales bacterium]|nr:hypothetical protein [Bacteroidales bacterium]